MRKKNYKGRCEKKKLKKCKEICRTYDAIASVYADVLDNNDAVAEIRCNVPLESDDASEYMSDFVCVKSDGDMMVRECVFCRLLTKPMTLKLLDISRDYWKRHGIKDWGIVIDEGEKADEEV